jgi:hypothetical protein
MAESTRSWQISGQPLRPGGENSRLQKNSNLWSRDGLMHPTALPLGLVIGCCLGVVTAVIAFF